MKRFPFDPELVAERTQLFPDYVCLDPLVVYHGTSSICESLIDSEGLQWTPGLVSKDLLTRVTSVFDQMQWRGAAGGGYPVLKGFSEYDFGAGTRKPIFLAESSYRAMLYAGAEWCGGETARALRFAISDLREYIASESLRADHDEMFRIENEELRQSGARLPPEPQPVDLEWLQRQIDELVGPSSQLDSLYRQHSHGVVYAIRFDEGQTASILRYTGMGIEVEQVSRDHLIAKVHVPADWQYDTMRQDPHRLRANVSNVLWHRQTGAV